jgi:hypothetical protein
LGQPVNLHAFIGATAWSCANRSAHRPRLVIDLSVNDVWDFDFSCCDGLDLILNAQDCDLESARAVAIRICEHGARLVVLLHSKLPKFSEFFYGIRR